MPKWFALVGAIVLAAELILLFRQDEYVLPEIVKRHPNWLLCCRWFLAVSAFLIAYPVDEKYIIFGFPFIAAVFERGPTGLKDFLGPLTPPAIGANLIFFLMLPRLVFSCWHRLNRILRKKEAS